MIRKIIIKVLFLIIFITPVNATTVDTFVVENNESIEVNSLYSVGGNIPYAFTSPNDMYITSNDIIYVADEDKVVVFYPNGEGKIIGKNILKSAQSVFVKDNEIYVADNELKQILVFNEENKLLRTYERPDELFFGEDTPFNPISVAVSSSNDIYIASLGTTDGLITLNQEGEFIGFYAANESTKSIYDNNLFSSKAITSFLKPQPSSVGNVFIDSNKMIYTSTKGSNMQVRKMNYNSQDLLEKNTIKSDYISDFYVDQYGNIITLESDVSSQVSVYTQNGDLIFTLGNEKINKSSQTNYLKTSNAIAIDSKQNIYIADAQNKQIQTFVATDIAHSLYKGIDLYNQGLYEESEVYFSKVLNVSTMFDIAYDSIAMSEYKNKNYDESLKLFEKSQNKEKYSDSFYYIRTQWISENFIILMMLVIIVTITFKISFKKINLKSNNYILQIFNSLKHPENTFYYIKYFNYFTVRKATITYILGYISLIYFISGREFLYNNINYTLKQELLIVTILYTLAIIIFIITNYFISSIMFGESNFKHMYQAFSLCLSPIIIILPLLAFSTKFLTLSEFNLYLFIVIIVIMWTLFLILYAINQMHNFTFKQVIINFLTTIFAIIVLITIIMTLLYLFSDMLNLIYSFIREVIL